MANSTTTLNTAFSATDDVAGAIGQFVINLLLQNLSPTMTSSDMLPTVTPVIPIAKT